MKFVLFPNFSICYLKTKIHRKKTISYKVPHFIRKKTIKDVLNFYVKNKAYKVNSMHIDVEHSNKIFNIYYK